MSLAQKQRNLLSDEVKKFIVESLACYDKPSQVAKAVKEEFDLDVTRQQCAAYNPTKVTGRELSQKWQDLFNSTRETFLENEASIGITHKAVRLRRLERLLDRAEAGGDLAMSKTILELIRKEMNDPPRPGTKVIEGPRSTGKDHLAHLKARYGGAARNSGAQTS